MPGIGVGVGLPFVHLFGSRGPRNLVNQSVPSAVNSWTTNRAGFSGSATSPTGDLFPGIVPTTASGDHRVQLEVPVTIDAGQYTLSAYVKPNGYDWGVLQFFDGTNVFRHEVNLSVPETDNVSGPGSSGDIESLPDGWFRISITGTSVATSTVVVYWYIQQTSASSYTGDGVSGQYVGGFQLETGDTPTNYVATP